MDGTDTSEMEFEDVTSTEDRQIQSLVGSYYDSLIEQMNGE